MTQSVDIRGVELVWDMAGEKAGPPLVWGHGLQSSMSDEDDMGLLDFASFRSNVQTLRYDARGHGRSGFTTHRDAYGWDQMALDQLDLATHAGLESYVAGGASLGAATALHAALHAPDRIKGLLLVVPPTGWETRAAQTDFYSALADTVETQGVEPLIQGMDAAPVPDPLMGHDNWRQHRIAGMRQADPVRLAGLFRGATTANLPPRDLVAQITCPALILAWTGDPGHPVTTAAELQHLLPNATVKLASTWEHVGTWTHEALAFMERL